MSLLFISHSSSDNAAAEEMRRRLSEYGFSTESSIFLDFADAGGIQAGQKWEQTLYRNIRACRAVIVLCSRASMASRWCFMEVTHARALGKHLFPVMIEPCEVDAVLTDHQVVDLTAGSEAGYARLFRGLLAAGADPSEIFNWKPGRSPYPGLMAFEQEDAAVFFGRDREIAEGLDLLNRIRRLADAGMVVVLGGSGSGKSSLVRAGIVPRLRKDVERWIIAEPFRPRDDPFRELSAVLSRAFSAYGNAVPPDWIRDTLRQSEESLPQEPGSQPASGLENALAKLGEFERTLPGDSVSPEVQRYTRLLRASLQGSAAAPAPARAVRGNPLVQLTENLRSQTGRDNATALIVVDQFEEMLGRGEDPRSNAFLRLLRGAADDPRRSVVVLATMRTDFLESFQKHPLLAGLRWEPLSVAAMGRAEIVQVIERPAGVAGIEFESGLVQTMVDDTATPDALPLLAFTLRELTDRYAQDRLLTVSEYRDGLGGLQGAVARSADELLQSAHLSQADEDLLRRAFLRMVRITEAGSYARASARWDEIPEAVRPVLERFVNARLLLSGDSGSGRTVEVAHEALFRSWGKLTSWLEASAEALRTSADVERVAGEWERSGHNEEYLWSGGRVARARELLLAGDLHVTPAGEAFITASHTLADARRRKELRRIRIAAGVFSVLFLIAAASGLFARARQNAATLNAREANWQSWQAEGERFVSTVSARHANWQQWQAEGQRFVARRDEHRALQARAAEAEQRRIAEQNAQIAETRLKEAERERMRVRLGNFIAQLDQLDREMAAVSEDAQRQALEAERTALRLRANETSQALRQKMAEAAGFRGDLQALEDFELGRLLESRVPRRLARLMPGFNEVMLFPDTSLSVVSEADLRSSYEGLLTPGQFEAALKLRGKRGAEAVELWKQSPRLHDVTVSPYLGRIIFAEQNIVWWNRLRTSLPAIANHDTPRSVQTAGLILSRFAGTSAVRRLRPAIEKRNWLAMAVEVENTRTPAGASGLRKRLEHIAENIRSEVRGSQP